MFSSSAQCDRETLNFRAKPSNALIFFIQCLAHCSLVLHKLLFMLLLKVLKPYLPLLLLATLFQLFSQKLVLFLCFL